MIRVVESGKYILIETKGQIKILILEKKISYAWVSIEPIGEILVASHKTHKANHILAVGNYRLYDVKDEKNLSDRLHLELYVGDGVWQGYLLPTGLPTDKKIRNGIIPTHEIITKTSVSD